MFNYLSLLTCALISRRARARDKWSLVSERIRVWRIAAAATMTAAGTRNEMREGGNNNVPRGANFYITVVFGKLREDESE